MVPVHHASNCASVRRSRVLSLCLLAAVAACVGRRPCSAGSLPVLLRLTFGRVEEEGRGEISLSEPSLSLG